MARRLAPLMLNLALACGMAGAQQDYDEPHVQVDGMRDPEMRSYRAVVAGLDAFDKNHQRLAPGAPGLRFRVLPRSGDIAGAGPALALRIATDAESIPLAVSADGTFEVPRLQAAYDGNADLIANRKRATFRILPEVRSAGLPANVRRLGDLRLECRVRLAIVKEEIPKWERIAANLVTMTADRCSMLDTTPTSY